jgi:hypothetical protein
VELEFRGEDESVPDLLRTLMARGIKIYGCTRKEPDLETIFERMVNGTPIGREVEKFRR